MEREIENKEAEPLKKINTKADISKITLIPQELCEASVDFQPLSSRIVITDR